VIKELLLARVVVFIDGQNFRKALKGLRFTTAEGVFRPEETQVRWHGFFSEAVKRLSRLAGFEHKLVRVYWYTVARIGTYMLPDEVDERVKWHARALGVSGGELLSAARRWVDEERRRLERIRAAYDIIEAEQPFVEFRYVGQLALAPFEPWQPETRVENGRLVSYAGTRRGEKGVDLGMALDMVAKMHSYDAALLASGDADFLPVVRHLKNNMKWVYLFSLLNEPDDFHYTSADLRIHVDLAFQMTRDDLASFLIVSKLPPYARAIVKEAKQ